MVTYIHIGMPKTGTTFLQRALRQKSQELRAAGVVYPDPLIWMGVSSEASSTHHFLAHAIQGRRRRYTPSADFSLLADYVAALKAEIAEGGGTGIVSSEDLAGFKAPEIRKLREHFPENTKILVYLRRQDAWFDSLYGQFLKVGRKTTVEQMVEDESRRLDYAGFLGPWAQAFGTENIAVRVYEGLQGTDLWRDLLLGLDRPEAAALSPDFERANESLSFELTMFLKALNIYGEQTDMRRMFEGLSRHFPNRPGLKYLTAEQAQALLERHAEGNRAVAETYLKRSTLFADLTPLNTVERQELTTTQAIQVFGGLTIRLLDRIRKLEAERKRDAGTAPDAGKDPFSPR
jgi:hypothetical protein